MRKGVYEDCRGRPDFKELIMIKPYYLKLPTRKRRFVARVKLICAGCSKPFFVPRWEANKGRKFCAPKCRKTDPLVTLLSRIDKQPNGCWNYNGTIGWGGYGQIKTGGISYTAHKLMWRLWNRKEVPKGLVIRHTCIGNPGCINPKHLLLGTQKENIQDIIRQGRFKSAFGTPDRKFSAETVREIRRLRNQTVKGQRKSPTLRELAKRYKTTDGAIWAMVNFKTYKDIK